MDRPSLLTCLDVEKRKRQWNLFASKVLKRFVLNCIVAAVHESSNYHKWKNVANILCFSM